MNYKPEFKLEDFSDEFQVFYNSLTDEQKEKVKQYMIDTVEKLEFEILFGVPNGKQPVGIIQNEGQ